MAMVDVKRAGLAGSPSPVIWADCPIKRFLYNPGDGIHIMDHFIAGRAANVSPNGTWELVGTNADLDVVEDDYPGVVLLAGSGADNDSSFLRSAAVYDLTMNSGRRFWFEIRAKVPDEDADTAIIAGLMEPTGCTAEGIADAGADLIDEDFIGFLAVTDATNMGNVQAVYSQGGDAAHTDIVASAHSPADDAYFKLGMKFDGKKTVACYADGVAVGTLDVDDLANDSLTNPLAIFFGFKACAAAAQGLEVDWVRFACDNYALGY